MIESNIGIIFFKSVQIIGWCIDTESFVDNNICILEFITNVQNTIIESMHSRNSNVDSEVVSILHIIVELIRINTLNMITHIFTLACNTFPSIIAVPFLNTLINE